MPASPSPSTAFCLSGCALNCKTTQRTSYRMWLEAVGEGCRARARAVSVASYSGCGVACNPIWLCCARCPMPGARHAVASSRLFCVLDAAIFCLLFPGIQASTNSPPPPTAAPPLPPSPFGQHFLAWPVIFGCLGSWLCSHCQLICNFCATISN